VGSIRLAGDGARGRLFGANVKTRHAARPRSAGKGPKGADGGETAEASIKGGIAIAPAMLDASMSRPA
jgi:hypothetical protein